jgi:hypothetical protein
MQRLALILLAGLAQAAAAGQGPPSLLSERLGSSRSSGPSSPLVHQLQAQMPNERLTVLAPALRVLGQQQQGPQAAGSTPRGGGGGGGGGGGVDGDGDGAGDDDYVPVEERVILGALARSLGDYFANVRR